MWTKVKNYLKMTPGEVCGTIKERVVGAGNIKTCKRIGIVALLTCIFNYFYFIINGYGGPDAVCEGVYYYIGEDTATASARWFIPYLNKFFGQNVIIPLVIIIFYALMIAAAAFFLFDLWEIKSAGFQIFSVSAMVCFPVITRQFAYLYTALAYSTAFLMVVLAAWLLKKKQVLSFIAATVCLIIMFGSFQSYIGAAATIVVIGFLLDMAKKRPILEALEDVGQYLICGIIAGILDLFIANAMIKAKGVTAYGRVSEVSLSESLKYLDFSIPAAYKWFFSYFDTDVLARNILYTVLFAIIIILVIANVIALIKNKKIVHSILFVVGILLLPLAMNVCAVVFPHNGIYDVMRYQYVLLIPLAFALFVPLAKNIVTSMLQWISFFAVFLLIAGYTISSNASAICYKLAYESTHDQALSMLSRVYELDGYDPDSTTIMFGGQPIGYGDTYVAFEQLFKYAIMESGPVFWGGDYGMTACRYFFFRNYMGVDPYGLTADQYWYVVCSPEYMDMPCWPAQGSVQMIDNYAVIKLSE